MLYINVQKSINAFKLQKSATLLDEETTRKHFKWAKDHGLVLESDIPATQAVIEFADFAMIELNKAIFAYCRQGYVEMVNWVFTLGFNNHELYAIRDAGIAGQIYDETDIFHHTHVFQHMGKYLNLYMKRNMVECFAGTVNEIKIPFRRVIYTTKYLFNPGYEPYYFQCMTFHLPYLYLKDDNGAVPDSKWTDTLPYGERLDVSFREMCCDFFNYGNVAAFDFDFYAMMAMLKDMVKAEQFEVCYNFITDILNNEHLSEYFTDGSFECDIWTLWTGILVLALKKGKKDFISSMYAKISEGLYPQHDAEQNMYMTEFSLFLQNEGKIGYDIFNTYIKKRNDGMLDWLFEFPLVNKELICLTIYSFLADIYHKKYAIHDSVSNVNDVSQTCDLLRESFPVFFKSNAKRNAKMNLEEEAILDWDAKKNPDNPVHVWMLKVFPKKFSNLRKKMFKMDFFGWPADSLE